MWFDRVRRAFCVGVVGVLVASLGGCGGASAGGNSNKAKPEKASITVSCFIAPACVPFNVALSRGYFKDEGLDVKSVIVPDLRLSFAKFKKGEVDIALDSTVGFLISQADGLDLAIVAENDLAPSGFLLISTVDPTIRSVTDLEGKKIGIDQHRHFIELLATASLAARNVNPAKVRFVPVPIAEMPAAMEKGAVDAAWLSDRFANIMENKGARRILDLIGGPTDRFPATAWASKRQFSQQNPNTVAAFNRAIVRGQRTTEGDLNAYFDGLSKVLRIPRQAANAIPPPPYVTTTNPVRLQRAADLLKRFRFINQRLDVRSMIPPSVKTNEAEL